MSDPLEGLADVTTSAAIRADARRGQVTVVAATSPTGLAMDASLRRAACRGSADPAPAAGQAPAPDVTPAGQATDGPPETMDDRIRRAAGRPTGGPR